MYHQDVRVHDHIQFKIEILKLKTLLVYHDHTLASGVY